MESKPHQHVSAPYRGSISRSVAGATPAGLSQRLVRSTSAVSLPEQARCYRQISEKTHVGSASSGEVRLHKAVAIGLFPGRSYAFSVMQLVPRGRADILRLADLSHHGIVSRAYLSGVSLKKTPPLPVSIACSNICRLSESPHASVGKIRVVVAD